MQNEKEKYRAHTAQSAERSREKYGSNKLTGQKKTSFAKRLLAGFSDPIIRILIAALVVNTVFTLKNFNIIESLGILAAILISTFVSALSEHRSENAFEKLSQEASLKTSRVMRSGALTILSSDDIVVGDIVLLGAGEAVPADGIIIEGSVYADQSALNGESREVCKKVLSVKTKRSLDSENRVFRGSMVTKGNAVMQVTEVGDNTFLGGVAEGLKIDTRDSPLKVRLSGLAKTISHIGYVLAAVVGFVCIFWEIFVDNGFDKASVLAFLSDKINILSAVIDALTLSITILVVAVPEGLPMMICVVLSSNMKRMMKDGILVKKPVGIETAGSLNLLFCDKTGTITTGVQSVDGVLLADGSYTSSVSLLKKYPIYELLRMNAIYNTECSYVRGRAVGSNSTDRAIASFFEVKQLQKDNIRDRIPFDSKYKYSAVRLPDGRVLVKGAPDVLIKSISHSILPDGSRCPFDLSRISGKYEELVKNASRMILVALCDRMPDIHGNHDMTYVCMISINDRIKKSAAPSVKTLRDAGIRVVMVTGDGKETASAVAKKTGIMQNDGDIAITSSEMAAMSDDELAGILPRLSVVARAMPSDKSRLVQISQSLELVVGMTGDGVNDAPALKRADVGFSMGAGAEIAKEAGDIVILDNDISAIEKTVLYGRTIFNSIRKFIVFQLTMNFSAVGVTLMGRFFGIDMPITIIQMLWVNIIMDTLGALAFASEAPDKYTMRDAPKRRAEKLLSAGMAAKIAWNGLMTWLVCIGFLASERIRAFFDFYNSPVKFLSAFFTLFIFLGIMNFFIARSERLNIMANIFANGSFIGITLLITVIQLLMVFFGGEIFRTEPLDVKTLCGLLATSFSVVPLDALRKLIMRAGLSEKGKGGKERNLYSSQRCSVPKKS